MKQIVGTELMAWKKQMETAYREASKEVDEVFAWTTQDGLDEDEA
jgi:hypothetical protein